MAEVPKLMGDAVNKRKNPFQNIIETAYSLGVASKRAHDICHTQSSFDAWYTEHMRAHPEDVNFWPSEVNNEVEDSDETHRSAIAQLQVSLSDTSLNDSNTEIAQPSPQSQHVPVRPSVRPSVRTPVQPSPIQSSPVQPSPAEQPSRQPTRQPTRPPARQPTRQSSRIRSRKL